MSTLDQWGDLVSECDGSDTAYHLCDALGSTDALLDDDEAATDRYQYRAVGAQSQQGTHAAPFTFVGSQNYYRESDLELYYAGARYYDPAAGRWLSRDPVGPEAGDVNLYRYVQNNPVNVTDPSGMEEFDQDKFERLLKIMDETVFNWWTKPFKAEYRRSEIAGRIERIDARGRGWLPLTRWFGDWMTRDVVASWDEQKRPVLRVDQGYSVHEN